jgi:hypothetical protein
MKARKLLDNAALGPGELAVLYGVFDEVWQAVEARHGGNAQSIEVGRLKLANGLLAAYRDGARDADQLKLAALKVLNS